MELNKYPFSVKLLYLARNRLPLAKDGSRNRYGKKGDPGSGPITLYEEAAL